MNGTGILINCIIIGVAIMACIFLLWYLKRYRTPDNDILIESAQTEQGQGQGQLVVTTEGKTGDNVTSIAIDVIPPPNPTDVWQSILVGKHVYAVDGDPNNEGYRFDTPDLSTGKVEVARVYQSNGAWIPKTSSIGTLKIADDGSVAEIIMSTIEYIIRPIDSTGERLEIRYELVSVPEGMMPDYPPPQTLSLVV